MQKTFSRRAVLGQITAGAAAATLGAPRHAFAQLDHRPWAYITDDEARWLAAVCDVFIPQDDYPSASQAGVVDYIDLQLATGYGQGAGLYMKGPFPEGTPQQGYQLPYPPAQLIRRGIAAARDEEDVTTLQGLDRADYVQRLSERTDPLGDTPATTFFTELLSLTNEGYFADPIYLGNHNYAGWKMVGFPGAHAYYTERVDDHDYTFDQPPMGIAHSQTGRNSLPRPIPEES